MKWIRPIISIMSLGSLITAAFLRMVDWQVITPILAGAVVWWFAARDNEKAKPTI